MDKQLLHLEQTSSSMEMDLREIQKLSYSELCARFEHFSKLGNRAEYIILLGTTLLLDHSRRLGERKWDIMESIAISTFQFELKEDQKKNAESKISKVLKWQKYCMDELSKKHGNTFRFKKLVGMLYESRKEYGKALELYKQLLKFDPEDLEIRRRVISIKMSESGWEDFSLLDQHLNECIMDVNAWKMKAYYLLNLAKDYHGALYCMEEVLLHESQNLDTINIIADLYLAIGNYSRSQQYFCLALSIQKTNLRALWGIIQCNSLKYEHLSTESSSSSTSNRNKGARREGCEISEKDKKLTQLAVKHIINIYSGLEENRSQNSADKKDEDSGSVIQDSQEARSCKVSISVLSFPTALSDSLDCRPKAERTRLLVSDLGLEEYLDIGV
ncbi:putative ER membrane protein complex subunit 2 [Cryptosporidium felis]|nr:putative ER membrane protein complex subunit 2 [Cryptosporidium felis]